MATRALSLLTAWALGPGGLRVVTATVDAENDASRRVLRRCGYEQSGAAGHHARGKIRLRREVGREAS